MVPLIIRGFWAPLIINPSMMRLLTPEIRSPELPEALLVQDMAAYPPTARYVMGLPDVPEHLLKLIPGFVDVV